MRYKNPTPNPLPASEEGAKMYLIRAETAVLSLPKDTQGPSISTAGVNELQKVTVAQLTAISSG